MAEETGTWRAIGAVSGLNQPFILDMIVKDDLVDVSIDNRHTLIARNQAKINGDRMFLFVNYGEVIFEDVTVRP